MNGTTKRRFFARLGGAAALPLLAACGAQQPSSTEGSGAKAVGKQKITYWGSFSGALGQAEPVVRKLRALNA